MVRHAALEARRRSPGASTRYQRGRFGTDARPRIGLLGYLGWGNYGDELFHAVYREHLGDSLALRVAYDRTRPPYFRRGPAEAVAGADGLVLGGGDLVVPWHLSGRYWDRAFLTRPLHVVGVGVATRAHDAVDPEVVAALRHFVGHPQVRRISARDEESAAWIERRLTPSVPVRRTSDLVTALTLPPVEPSEDVLGIVTRDRPGHDNDYAAIAKLAQRAQRRGMRVRHIVLGTGIIGRRDLAEALALDLPGRELVASESLDDLSRAIGGCRMLASMKFHGSVVAAMYGVPSLVLVPTAKNRRFFARLGRPELVRRLGDPDLPAMVDELPPRIEPAGVAAMRAEALAELTSLRDDLLALPRAGAAQTTGS